MRKRARWQGCGIKVRAICFMCDHGGKKYSVNSDDEDEDHVRLATAPGARKQQNAGLPLWMRGLKKFHEKRMQPLFLGKSTTMKQPLHAQGERGLPLSSAHTGDGSNLPGKSSVESRGDEIRVLDSDEAAI